MPIRMRSALLHGNVFHYILLSANAGVKPVCSPHVATTRRLGKHWSLPPGGFVILVTPVGAASFLWAVGLKILGKDNPTGLGAPQGPSKLS